MILHFPHIVLLTVALAVTQILDWHTTRTILRKPGGHEQNPVMAKLMAALGMDPALILKGIAVTAIGYYVGTVELLFLIVLVLIYVAVLAHNWRSM